MSQSCPVVADSVANASKLAISDGALSTHRQGEMVPPSRRSWRRRCSSVACSGNSTRANTNSRRCGSDWRRRSEEHTSELQSLMRTSYAVFCLKNKQNIYNTTYNTHL